MTKFCAILRIQTPYTNIHQLLVNWIPWGQHHRIPMKRCCKRTAL